MGDLIDLGSYKNILDVQAITGVPVSAIEGLMEQGSISPVKPNMWNHIGINQVLLAKGLAQKRFGDSEIICRLVKALPNALRGQSLANPLAIWAGLSKKGESTHYGLWTTPYGQIFDGEAYPLVTSYVTMKAWGYGGAQ